MYLTGESISDEYDELYLNIIIHLQGFFQPLYHLATAEKNESQQRKDLQTKLKKNGKP